MIYDVENMTDKKGEKYGFDGDEKWRMKIRKIDETRGETRW